MNIESRGAMQTVKWPESGLSSVVLLNSLMNSAKSPLHLINSKYVPTSVMEPFFKDMTISHLGRGQMLWVTNTRACNNKEVLYYVETVITNNKPCPSRFHLVQSPAQRYVCQHESPLHSGNHPTGRYQHLGTQHEQDSHAVSGHHSSWYPKQEGNYFDTNKISSYTFSPISASSPLGKCFKSVSSAHA